MTSNLHEFLSVAILVACTTGFVGAFRYTIIALERPDKEEI